jgi:hypothetical protein
VLAAAPLVLVLAAGCGGARQDAHEPSGSFAMEVVRARFPTRQTIARPSALELTVRNSGTNAVPNVAVTVDSFNYSSTYPQLAASKRPVWAIEQGPGASPQTPVETQEVSLPGSGQTAYVNTWALGRLGAGQTRSFRWLVVPVKPGAHTVHYRFAAGLAGKAAAHAPGGGLLQGQFAVNIAPAPPATYVNPSTGRVLAGSGPIVP